MKKFLDCDWLRGMQFLGNTVQKKGNSVQKKGNLVQKRVTKVTFWLANKQRNSLRANQMRHLNGAKIGSAPNQIRVGVCSTLGSFSNDDGNGTIGLLRKTTTLHVHHAFL